MIGSTKDNLIHPLSIKEILDELEISKDECYRALPVLKNEGVKLHLKKKVVPAVLIIILDVCLKPL